MKPINLFWYKMLDGSSNYGDELNLFIIKHITDRKVHHIPYPYKWYKVPFIYLKNLLTRRGYVDLRGMLRSVFAKNILLGIGSVLQIYDRKGVVVWGSGIIRKDSNVNKADFRAVRGLETVKRLKTLGYNTDVALGDPALLLPLLINPAEKKRKIGIVPNYKHYDEIVEDFDLPADFVLIDLRDDIYKVTEEMTSCEYIIATSLHGLIVAHAYERPALWVDMKLKNKLAGDDIKFSDYFSSVNIVPYKPVVVPSLDFDSVEMLMRENHDRILINTDLNTIQKSLLRTFPFTLKKEFQV